MSKYLCSRCSKEFNNIDRKPLSLPCNDVFCEKCIHELYDKINHIIICPSHKKEIQIEFNKIPICSKIMVNLKKINSIDSKDLSLYCIRHNKKKLKFFCEQDKSFLCDSCISLHNGHKIADFKLNKDNFTQEINLLKNNFEEMKNKYLNDKQKINTYISLTKNHFDEQINRINNYFNILMNVINEKKNKFILKIKNISKENINIYEKIQNIFSVSDEKYSFINNEFYYINNDLLNKGEYETFYNLKHNFIKEIQNFEKYITINIFNNKDFFNNTKNKFPIYIYPRNGILEKNGFNKEEELFGKFEDISIDINKNLINNSSRKKINNKNNNNIAYKEKEIFKNINREEKENNSISINNLSNNMDSSLIDKKSNLNNNDSFVDKQLVETGFTFFLINKNDVKNVFKQQDSEQSQNDLINISNSNHEIYNKEYNKEKVTKENNNKENNNINITYKNNNSRYGKNRYTNNNINNIKNINNNIINNNININFSNKNNLNDGNKAINNNQNKNNYNNYQNNNNYYHINNIHNNNNNQNNNNNSNLNKILSNLNLYPSNGKKPYKLLNIMNSNKDPNYFKKREKHNIKRNSKNRENQDSINKNFIEDYHKEKYIKKSFYDKDKSDHLISYNNIAEKNEKINLHNFIKSEDNYKNKIAKTKINNINNRRDNSTRRMEHKEHNSTSINSKRSYNIRADSLNKKFNNYDIKGQISYIYANMNNSLLNNNLISSYNKEYSKDFKIFNKNIDNKDIRFKKNFKNIYQNGYNSNKYNSQILTEINDDNAYKNSNKNKNENKNKRIISEYLYSQDNKNKENNFQNQIIHKKISQPKYSLKDINIRNNNDKNRIYDNKNYNEREVKRGRSTRQKNSFSEIVPMEV